MTEAPFDGDGAPEIVLAGVSTLHVLDGSGDEVTPAVAHREDDHDPDPGVPLVAELDGEHPPEVVIATHEFLTAYRWTGDGLEVAWFTVFS